MSLLLRRREREGETKTHESIEEERVVKGLTGVAEDEGGGGIVGGLFDGLHDGEMVEFGS